MENSNKTKWIVGVVVVLLIIGVGKYFLSKPSVNKPTEKITIGAVLPLTGAGAFIGEELKKGMDLANQEAKLNLFIEDSATDPKVGVSAFNKLVSVNKINASVVGFSSVMSAVMPIAEQLKMPVIQTAVSAAKIGAGSPYSFRYFTSGEQEAPIMAKFAVNDLSLKTASILYLEGEYGVAYKDAFTATFTSLGGKVLSTEIFQRTGSDFRTQLTKIKAQNPEAIYVIGMDPHLGVAFKQIKELKINSTILTNWILAAPAVQEAVGNNDEGVYFTSPAYYFDAKTPVTLDFIKKYKDAYGKEPSAYAAIGYDTLKLFTLVDSSNGLQDMAGQLKKIKNFKASMGELSVDSNGEITFPLYPVKIENQKMKLLK